ncbi:DoxX family protein [Naumannella halotolerans]|uniref:Putative membrane protein n=1 Tax=Naumannella halotolerans TaxID=993414 RepID=A0A4R7J0K0_9ACTN|nr:hypothetical protein [Naumannella halotolerans]TDT29803.1 putative membrane protein [Naumannella halotolerans]
MVSSRLDRVLLIQAFGVSGLIHLLRPQVFEPIVPQPLPRRETVIISGVAELICATGLALRPTRRIAGWASAGLLVAIFPANVKMAVDAQHSHSPLRRWGTLARLPLQWTLIRMALRAGRG